MNTITIPAATDVYEPDVEQAREMGSAPAEQTEVVAPREANLADAVAMAVEVEVDQGSATATVALVVLGSTAVTVRQSDAPADVEHVAIRFAAKRRLAMSFNMNENGPIESHAATLNVTHTVQSRTSKLTPRESCGSTCIETAPWWTLRRSDRE